MPRKPPLPLDPKLCADLVASPRWQRKVCLSDSGCLLWVRVTSPNRYGQILLQGVTVKSHRVAWVAANGKDIPDSLEIDHLCRVRRCVQASHLEPVTRRINTLRGTAPAAELITRTVCPAGHPLVNGNITASHARIGQRKCLICTRERSYRQFQAISQARAALGLSRSAYAANYGWSTSTALNILDNIAKEVTVEAEQRPLCIRWSPPDADV
jgi:HNH endonuclease